MLKESNPLTTGKLLEGNENPIAQARALEQKGDLVEAAIIFEQEGRFKRAAELYIRHFTEGCLAVESLLEKDFAQKAVKLWIGVRDAYTEIRRIESGNDLEIENSDELMDRFNEMAEKMRPFLPQK